MVVMSIMIDRILNWFDSFRVPIGVFLSLVIVSIGGLLIWYDRHAPITKIETVKVIGALVSTSNSGLSNVTSPATKLTNINTASASELDKLPGIGPAYAGRIVEYREKNGQFKATHDIVKIKGIGEATYAKISGLISTGGE